MRRDGEQLTRGRKTSACSGGHRVLDERTAAHETGRNDVAPLLCAHVVHARAQGAAYRRRALITH